MFLLDRNEDGVVQSTLGNRSYIVHTDSGQFRRNRLNIAPLPPTANPPPATTAAVRVPSVPTAPVAHDAATYTRNGHRVVAPQRLDL